MTDPSMCHAVNKQSKSNKRGQVSYAFFAAKEKVWHSAQLPRPRKGNNDLLFKIDYDLVVCKTLVGKKFGRGKVECP